jgi:Protein of unknown function (DUF620)
MRSAILAFTLIWSIAGYGQEAVKPSITAEEVIEKAIQATGGREAAMKMTSLVAKGSMEIVSMGATASTEMYSKAPDKRFSVTNVEGYGEVKQGYDGKIAWSAEPQNGVVDVSGDQLANARREAQFNGDLRWKDLYKTVEVTGKAKVGDRDCWVLKLTPGEGKPVTRYYDSETFLLSKTVSTADSPQGPAEISAVFANWRDVGNGTKSPYTITITLPGIGDLVMKYKEYLYNVEIDDARFAKPKS